VNRRAFLSTLVTGAAGAAASCARPLPTSPISSRARGPIVIVPGTGGGKWLYERLAASLAEKGRRAVPLALPGMGERIGELRKDIDANTHAADVGKQLADLDLRDVTLVGHSYGGMVVAGAVGPGKGRIARLVFLDAYVPRDGESVLQQDPEFGRFMAERVEKEGEGWRIPKFAGSQFFDDPAAQKFFEEHDTECPWAMYTSPVSVDAAGWSTVGKGYVSFAQFQLFEELGKRKAAEGWPVRHLPYKHLGCYTNPAETAEALLGAEG
jgi:pimeloyl-ACP methyl ester carboxylesterase